MVALRDNLLEYASGPPPGYSHSLGKRSERPDDGREVTCSEEEEALMSDGLVELLRKLIKYEIFVFQASGEGVRRKLSLSLVVVVVINFLQFSVIRKFANGK